MVHSHVRRYLLCATVAVAAAFAALGVAGRGAAPSPPAAHSVVAYGGFFRDPGSPFARYAEPDSSSWQ